MVPDPEVYVVPPRHSMLDVANAFNLLVRIGAYRYPPGGVLLVPNEETWFRVQRDRAVRDTDGAVLIHGPEPFRLEYLDGFDQSLDPVPGHPPY